MYSSQLALDFNITPAMRMIAPNIIRIHETTGVMDVNQSKINPKKMTKNPNNFNKTLD
jgi:hypothetical protein